MNLYIPALLLCAICCRSVLDYQQNAVANKIVLFEGGFEGEVIAVVDGDTLMRKQLATAESLGTTGQRLKVPDQAVRLTLHCSSTTYVVDLDSIKKPVLRVDWSPNGWWIVESEKIPVYE